MLEIGSVIDGKYKILNQIGKGGMSVVYLALNERANKTWAIKGQKRWCTGFCHGQTRVDCRNRYVKKTESQISAEYH